MGKRDLNKQRQLLKDIYGFEFPDTFFEFWEFVCSMPPNLIKDILEIQFIGAFKIFKADSVAEKDNLLWDRYYNDLPEFFTLMEGGGDGLHWGYYLDDPNHPTFPVAYYYSNDAFELTVGGDNLFETLRGIVEEYYEMCLEEIEDDVEEIEECEEKIQQLSALRSEIQKYYTGNRMETGENYVSKYQAGKFRQIVAQTRDGMGIVVPSNLYKSLRGEDKFQIWNYKPTLEEVGQMTHEAMNALKEGYPATALKLGKDLWLYQEYRTECYTLLDAAYTALGRILLSRMLGVAKKYREYCDSKRSKY